MQHASADIFQSQLEEIERLKRELLAEREQKFQSNARSLEDELRGAQKVLESKTETIAAVTDAYYSTVDTNKVLRGELDKLRAGDYSSPPRVTERSIQHVEEVHKIRDERQSIEDEIDRTSHTMKTTEAYFKEELSHLREQTSIASSRAISPARSQGSESSFNIEDRLELEKSHMVCLSL